MDIATIEESMPQAGERNRTRLKFTGTGKEFFKIWIVNIFLSVITLGIYSAWAKVRTNRYFYSNTSLSGSSFQYLAEPISILKGRLVAVVLLVAYSLVQNLFPVYGSVAFLLLLLAIPALIVLSLSFRMRNTAYRNITFHFQRDFKQAYLIFAIPVLLMSLFVIPMMIYGSSPEVESANEYNAMLEEYFADEEFSMEEERALDQYIEMNQLEINEAGYAEVPTPPLWAFIPYLLMFLLFPLWEKVFSAFKYSRIQFGTSNFKFGGKAWDFYKMYLLATGVMIGLGVFVATMAAFIQQTMMSMGGGVALMGAGVVVLFAVYMLFYAYFSVYKQNLIVNNVSIDNVLLISNLEVMGMWWIYASNTVVLFLTLGLATPWAKVRAAKYRLECTAVISNSLDNFVAQKETERRALGEEIGEAFDVDIGF